MTTRAKEIIVLEASLLLYLLELKLRYPSDITPYLLQRFFIGKTEIISKEQIAEELRPR